ncbi:cytochrome P450 [Aspergillus insuetus]
MDHIRQGIAFARYCGRHCVSDRSARTVYLGQHATEELPSRTEASSDCWEFELNSIFQGIFTVPPVDEEVWSDLGLKFGPANVVILNHWRDVQELLEKRGHIYSSRPANYIANEIICKNNTHILFAPCGDDWKALRKGAQGLFTPRELAGIQPIQEAEATQTVYDMIRDPTRYYEHIKRYTTAVILASVFGQRGEDFDSPNIQALYDVQNRFTALLEPSAAPPVDGLTFLQYLPEFVAPWKRKAEKIRRDQRALYFRLYSETKDRMRSGKRTDCFMEKLIDDQEKNKLDDEHTTYLGGILMEAGSDTTSSTLLSFLLAMLENPAALKQAQEEVDRVCGVGSVAYYTPLETRRRWRDPSMLTQTDTYKGYVFPAGTIFFVNTWAIHRAESEYEKPDVFNPDRWLAGNTYGTKDPSITSDQQRKSSYGWGAGRRICSGQKMAETSLKSAMAKMGWALDFEIEGQKEGGGGRPDVSVETGYDGGFLVCPKKFPIGIQPRSESHANVIRRESKALSKYFNSFAA